MAILSAVVFFVTLFYAISADNLFKTHLTTVLLVIFGALTLVCLCISTVGGGTVYKVGFYVLHGGLVLLIIGFIIYGALGKKYDVTVYSTDVYYDSIRDTTVSGEVIIDLGFKFRLDGVQAEYHLDEEGKPTSSPKMYSAVLTVIYPGEDTPKAVEISVNKPLYINGYKIYLMSMDTASQGATLLFKKDPAEFTITSGIVLLIVGSFLMCYFGDVKKKGISSGGNV
jgi:hypothetical protein